jgi:Rps23 Pro-64 3,4-dihydroxylase Tpa1-like proline 4-hydroxylase
MSPLCGPVAGATHDSRERMAAPAGCEQYDDVPRAGRLSNVLTDAARCAPAVADALDKHGVVVGSSGIDVDLILKVREALIRDHSAHDTRAAVTTLGWVWRSVSHFVVFRVQARAEVLAQHAAGVTARGKMSAEIVDHATWRSDSVLWLSKKRKEELPFVALLDAQVSSLCEELELHLRARGEISLTSRHDAQISLFPSGGGFAKHFDTKSLHGPGRKVTIILYLNAPEWSGGGQLRIFPAETMGGSAAPVTIEPTAGTVVVMRADVPHEVLPSTAPGRMALTVWVDGALMDKHPSFVPLPVSPPVRRAFWQRILPPW